ncbi:DUF4264 family protein [Anaeroselena agilis]|uniref:DUF4264 family protein n=1 Tax=Anaeroselena agilis TaxID=3063788 RepID=A0ABU3P023_9FIRM|nr:DUF4264 family protein [Selenomonadales bacterium 4137-cl]
MDGENAGGKTLEMIAARAFPAAAGLVDVVDFLNKALKREGYVFGVSKAGDKMTMTVYRTDSKETCD